MNEQAYREIIDASLEEDFSKEEFNKFKVEIARKYSLEKVPRNSDILEQATASEGEQLHHLLQRKTTRSISGVSMIAVMAKPTDVCPHGVCYFCPKGKEAPRSYTGEEPAALRARHNAFDPWDQVTNRVQQLSAIGHPTDKAELILMGGTFPFMDWDYQKEFLKGCYDAMIGKRTKTFEESKKLAEHSKVRPVGVTIETRPDWAKEEHIDRMLELGATRVELGVQVLDDVVYEKVHRGHTVADVIESTQLLKDSALKINYHLMPGLPGSSWDNDLKSFKRVFNDADFKPDMLKIYPTLVMPGTQVYQWWKRGEYTPMRAEEAATFIAEVKRFIPPWVRVMRVLRDIPATLVADGVKRSDLRELVKKECIERDIHCACIRCREVGYVERDKKLTPKDIEIRSTKYEASSGTEYFISAEDFDQNILIGFIRLRIPSKKAHRPEVTERTALIRELHVYGNAVVIGEKAKNKEYQHSGWGKKLLARAEEIALKENASSMLILSGIGVKEYYAKQGYAPSGAYMAKILRNV